MLIYIDSPFPSEPLLVIAHFNFKIYNFEDIFCTFFSGRAKYVHEHTSALPFLHTNHNPSFHNKLWESVIDSNAPRKKRVIKGNQLPFMNGQFRKAINVKGMLKTKSLKFKTQEMSDNGKERDKIILKKVKML